MYIVSIEVKESPIDGKGVFAKEDIAKGSIVWQYTEGHDKKMTVDEFNELDKSTKKALQRIAYLSPTSGLWVRPPDNDPACYTNHDPETSNTTVEVDSAVSDEPIFVANRNIRAGEEITNNYTEFDSNSIPEKFEWLKSTL